MKARLAGAALVIASVGVTLFLISDRERLGSVLDSIRDLGPWSAPACAALIAAGSVVCVPRWLYTVSAGFVCGAWLGMPAALVGGSIGAVAAFVIGRTVGREWVARSRKASIIDAAMADGGFTLVALVRLSPVLPCGMMSYLFGATRISFGRYVLATFLGMIPGAILYAILGAAARQIADLWSSGEWTPGSIAYAAAGGAVTLAVIVYMAVLVRRHLLLRIRGDATQDDVYRKIVPTSTVSPESSGDAKDVPAPNVPTVR
jgi:uncharacterized membrane protein YdjX (TVP38/TMEM64 family)